MLQQRFTTASGPLHSFSAVSNLFAQRLSPHYCHRGLVLSAELTKLFFCFAVIKAYDTEREARNASGGDMLIIPSIILSIILSIVGTLVLNGVLRMIFGGR